MAITDAAQIQELSQLFYRTPIMSQISQYDLLRLLAAPDVEVRHAAPGDTIIDPSTTDLGLVVILTGTFRYQDAYLGPENVIGLPALRGGGPYSAPLIADSAGTYVWIPKAALDTLSTRSSSFGHCVGNAPHAGEVVDFVLQNIALPKSVLIWLLAREIVTQFDNDQVLIVTDGAAPSPPVQVVGVDRLFHCVGFPTTPAALAGYDYIFLDDAACSSIERVVEIMPAIAANAHQPSMSDPALLRTMVLLADQSPADAPGVLNAIDYDKLSARVSASCRITLDRQVLSVIDGNWNRNQNPPVAPEPNGPDLRANLGAWARALTHRRTGLAIAGGGVWSMQAVYILRELAARNVPVDVVVGPSAGAMIGGFYGLRGQTGLNQIVRQGTLGCLDLMAIGSVLSPRLMQWYFECKLGCKTKIQGLPNEFYPTSTNLSEGQPSVFTSGSLARGITAASSAVPVVAPTVSDRVRYVDGAFSDNTPVTALRFFGVTLSFGANTFPPAKQPVPLCVPNRAESILPSWLNQLKGLGPLNRLWAFAAAFNLLGSLSGAAMSRDASVPWNSEVPIDSTFLLTTLFKFSQAAVDFASQNKSLAVAIDKFEVEWNALKARKSTAATR